MSIFIQMDDCDPLQLYRKYKRNFEEIKSLNLGEDKLNELFQKSVCLHDIRLVKWTWDLSKYINVNINIHISNETYFRYCFLKKRIIIAKWLWNKSLELNSPINIHAENEEIFTKSIIVNNTKTMEWLLTIANETNSPIDIHTNNEYIFCFLCGEGNMKKIEQFWNLSLKLKSPINIHAYNDKAFSLACIKDRLDVVKWLFELSNKSNTKIDICHNDNKAFGLACEYGNINTVNFLYNQICKDPELLDKLLKTVSANDGLLFKNVCRSGYYGNFDIAKFLWENIIKKYNIRFSLELTNENYNEHPLIYACKTHSVEDMELIYNIMKITHNEIKNLDIQCKVLKTICNNYYNSFFGNIKFDKLSYIWKEFDRLNKLHSQSISSIHLTEGDYHCLFNDLNKQLKCQRQRTIIILNSINWCCANFLEFRKYIVVKNHGAKLTLEFVDTLYKTSIHELDTVCNLIKCKEEGECMICKTNENLYILPCSKKESLHIMCGTCVLQIRQHENIKCPYCQKTNNLY